MIISTTEEGPSENIFSMCKKGKIGMGSINANQCCKRFVLKIQKGQMDLVWFWFRRLQITTRTCKMSFRAACLSVCPSVPHFLDKKHSVAVNCEDRTLVYKKFSFNLIRGLFFFFFWWYNLEVKKGLLFQMTKQWFNCTIALSIVANKMQDWCPETSSQAPSYAKRLQFETIAYSLTHWRG